MSSQATWQAIQSIRGEAASAQWQDELAKVLLSAQHALAASHEQALQLVATSKVAAPKLVSSPKPSTPAPPSRSKGCLAPVPPSSGPPDLAPSNEVCDRGSFLAPLPGTANDSLHNACDDDEGLLDEDGFRLPLQANIQAKPLESDDGTSSPRKPGEHGDYGSAVKKMMMKKGSKESLASDHGHHEERPGYANRLMVDDRNHKMKPDGISSMLDGLFPKQSAPEGRDSEDRDNGVHFGAATSYRSADGESEGKYGSSHGNDGSNSSNRFLVLQEWVMTAEEVRKQEEQEDGAPLGVSAGAGGRGTTALVKRGSYMVAFRKDFIKDLRDESLARSQMLLCWTFMLIHPCSFKRAAWDAASLLLVAYDLAVLPLQFFEPPESALSAVMAWVTRVYWTMDMPLSFLTGFLLSDGSIQMRPGTIVRHYMRTWFVMDLGLIIVDWTEVVLNTANMAGEVGRVGKLSRIFRIIRLCRLLRLARLARVVKLFTFRIQSEKIVIISDICKILLSIIAVAHLVACFWYGIANKDGSSDTWLHDENLLGKSLEHRYIISLHWSLAQFSGGMDEYRAQNFRERFYNVVVFLLGFMMASVCISGLTSSMTRLHILASHQSRQLSVLRRYLLQNGISDRLALRVQRNALHAISEQQRLMTERSVELLNSVNESLRVELHFEMYSPVLEVHPFFCEYITESPQVMCRVCHNAMSTLLICFGDVIFHSGEIPEYPKMYIVCNGTMEYIPGDGRLAAAQKPSLQGLPAASTGSFSSKYSGFRSIPGRASNLQPENYTRTLLHSEDWLAEASLWTLWMHRGILKGASDGRICELDAKKFIRIVGQFQGVAFDPKPYAYAFVERLNEITKQKSDDGDEAVTDLPFDDNVVPEASVSASPVEGARRIRDTLFGKQTMMDVNTAPNRSDKKRESVFFGEVSAIKSA